MLEGARGLYHANSHSIDLEADMPSRVEAVNIVLHELGHAIWNIYSLPRRPKEERVVSVMGVAWAQVFRDNPKLLAWVARSANVTLPER